MADVTVDMQDLELLAKLLLERSVENRAHLAVRIRQLSEHREGVMRYMAAVDEATPAARGAEELYFHALLDSLASGENVPQALSSFVAPQARSVAAAERRARRTR